MSAVAVSDPALLCRCSVERQTRMEITRLRVCAAPRQYFDFSGLTLAPPTAGLCQSDYSLAAVHSKIPRYRGNCTGINKSGDLSRCEITRRKAPLCFLAGSSPISDREVSARRAAPAQTRAAAIPDFSRRRRRPRRGVKRSLAVVSSAEPKLIYSLKSTPTKQPPAIVSLPVGGGRGG